MAKVKSIITDDLDHCYLCGMPKQNIHHCIHGTANRKHSDRLGLVIPVCYQCHQAIHSTRKLDLQVMQGAQRVFEEKIGNREDFRRIFGKSWL